MRKVSLLGFFAGANFATAGLGRYVDGENGKLAISNLTPLLFLMVAIPSFLAVRDSMNRNVLGFLVLFNLLGWLSFVLFLFGFGWQPNIPVLGFQEVEIVFVLLLIWYASRQHEEFLTMVRVGTLCSALISAAYGLSQIRGGTFLVLTFGMDDKSQAAVLFCCQAFVLIRYFGGTVDFIAAAGLMLMSFMTLSRLPVFFIPVMMLALATRSRWGAFLAVISGCLVIAVAIAAGDAMTQIFKVLDRLSSVDAIQSDNATSAHFLLIQTALDLKFYDTIGFLFGTGPGNFAKALTDFPINLDQLNAVDPGLINEARIGRAPMHSTPLSILLDYSLVIFCLLGFMLIRVVRYLVINRQPLELLFVTSLFAASMFYSLHNKPYLFLYCAAIAAIVMWRVDQPIAVVSGSRPSLEFSPRDDTEGAEYRQ